MRHIALLAILLLAWVTSARAQVEERFSVTAQFSVNSSVTDSTWYVNINEWTDHYGAGYLPNGIVVGYHILDAAGREYTIDSVLTSNFSRATVRVEELQADGLGPTGRGTVWNPLANAGFILPPPDGVEGVSDVLLSRIAIHNAILSDSLSTSLDAAQVVQIARDTGFVERLELADTATAIRADFPTDTQLSPAQVAGIARDTGFLETETDPIFTNAITNATTDNALTELLVRSGSNIFTRDVSSLPVPTLQEVTDEGNTTTNDINVDGKITSGNTQVLSYPRGDLTGTLIVGDGGQNLVNSAGESGRYNTYVGMGAGGLDSAGLQNTASGYQALYSNTTGSSNTANGYQALYSNTTGADNTANGYQVLFSNTTGRTPLGLTTQQMGGQHYTPTPPGLTTQQMGMKQAGILQGVNHLTQYQTPYS